MVGVIVARLSTVMSVFCLCSLVAACAPADRLPSPSSPDSHLWLEGEEPALFPSPPEQPSASAGAARSKRFETKVLGSSELPSPQGSAPGQATGAQDCASCAMVQPPTPTVVYAPYGYAPYGYGYGYGYGSTVARPVAPRSSAPSSLPPVAGDWPKLPNYGPPAMGDTGKKLGARDHHDERAW